MSIPKLLAAMLLLCFLLTACTASADNRLGGLRRASAYNSAAGSPGSFFLSGPYLPPLHLAA